MLKDKRSVTDGTFLCSDGGGSRSGAHLSLFLSGRPLTVFDFMTQLSTERAGAGLVGLELLSDDGEVGLVGGQAQHDQVG